MKRIAAVLIACTCAGPSLALAAEDDLAEARRLLRSGKYAEAAEIYRRFTPDPAATLGLARALAAEGRLEEAAERLSSGAGEHADVHAELARLAFERGDYEAATIHVETALRLDPHELLARWIRGELFRTGGKLDEAEEAYRWLVRFYNQRQAEIKRAESLRWIGLAAARHARWNRLSGQYDFLVNALYPRALALEPDYWPAHYESGLLFLEKYNRADAAGELKTALELNPNAAEVHVALAEAAILDRQIDQAQASLERAIQINPRLASAWLVKADLAWANFQPQEAARLLEEQALPLNPVSEEALGRLAACYAVLDGPPEEQAQTRLTRLVDRVTGRNERAGRFFFTLACWLKERHKRREAEAFFEESIRRMPQLVGPRAELGMMYMDAGEEAKGHTLLAEAFEADPFNVRVDNVLKVLDVLEGMETLRTEECILRFDSEQDGLLARYASEFLEAAYPELCTTFGYRPPNRPLVEIFNRAQGVDGHQWFSTRLIGLPYLGTVAASTGSIVAMVSPNEPSVAQRFNWARVLRHEMVHVITLQQTRFNVPHWYTEGLAVWSEGNPRPQTWNELLVARVPQGELFDLETINFGFTRPDSSDDWHLAYCQAELYVEHMLEGRSPEVLRKLLAAYADNLTTGEAIQRVFGVSEAEFEQGYVEHLKRLVAGMPGLKRSATEAFADLLQRQRQQPEDADLAAQVAYGYLRRGANEEARQLAERALELRPKHPLAGYVVARLWVQAERPQQAIDLLEACLDRKDPEPRALNLLAGLKLKAGAFAEAAELYRLGRQHDPYHVGWDRALARAYLKSANNEKLAEVVARLAEADPDDLASRKKLAQIALEGEDFEVAADWANQALRIDVTDSGIHRLFAEALVGGHNYAKAIEHYEVVIQLDPEALDQRFALAEAYLKAGKSREARRALEELLRLDPDHLEAGTLLEELEAKERM